MQKIKLLAISFFIILLMGACKKEQMATVSTADITEITTTSAKCGGDISDDGNSFVTQRGICWNTSPNPTINNQYTSDGNGSGSYTSTLSGLVEGVTYYVRAYAINSMGTAYGEEKNFITGTTPPPPTNQPTVTTNTVSNISATSATCGGNVTSDGNSAVTAKGVCWSTSQNPTIANNKTNDGQGMGTFTSNITGLTSSTTYYVRAYATNVNGTSYGEQRSFTAGTFTDSRDGNVYKTVRIDNQTWMAENLRYLPNVSAPATPASGTYGVYYYVYDYSGTSVSAAKATSNYSTYGVLYSWKAAMASCPAGWHLPSDAEWKDLEMFLGMTQDQADDVGYRGTNQGSQLAGNADLWENGTLENTSGFGTSGVFALPGGCRSRADGSFHSLGSNGHWWSITEVYSSYAWRRYLSEFSSSVYRDYANKDFGFSVRCVKD